MSYNARFGFNLYVQLSDYNLILIFTSEFPDIPRKISEYLRTDFPSGANTRKMRGFHKALNSNDLYLKGILLLCKKHHFGLRNGPFQGAIWFFLASEIGLIALRNGQYQKAVFIFSDYDIGYIKSRFYLKCPLLWMI